MKKFDIKDYPNYIDFFFATIIGIAAVVVWILIISFVVVGIINLITAI